MATFDSIYPDGNHGNLFDRLTWNQKKQNDYEWAKKCAIYIDGLHHCYGDVDNLKRVEMNYRLANGRGEKEMLDFGKLTMPNVLSQFGFSDNDIYGNIQHHPIIQQVYNAMVGEQQLRPLTPTALDTSLFASSEKKRERTRLVQEYIQQSIVAPLKAQAQQMVMQQYMQEYGVQDPYQLSPQEQMQMQSDIENRTKAMSFKEIDEYLHKEYKGVAGIQAQRILDYVMSEYKIKWITDENFKNLIIAGEEIYHVGVRNNRAFVDQVNPLGFYYVARPNSSFIEDGVIWKHEQYITIPDLYMWHGSEIGNSTKLKDQLNLISGNRRKLNEPPPQFVVEVSKNPYLVKDAPSPLTNDGQQYLASILGGDRGYAHRGILGEIRYSHTAWVGLRKLKQITRWNSDKNKKMDIWMDESYTFNPLNVDENGYRDIEENICWAPEIWEASVVNNDIFLGIGPVKSQYKSLQNPYLVKGPYVGGSYSKLMNNTERIAPIDPAKPWQYKFNLQMARIHELEATDLGKVLHTTLQAKPADWSFKEYFLMMKYGKMAIADTTSEGWTPDAHQLIKQMDLGTLNNIADKLQYLEFIRQQIILSMNYNPSRLGLQGPTVPVTNNQQNIVQSSYQTNDIFQLHAQIVENMLNVLVNVVKDNLREREENASYILDDLSLADLNLNWDVLDLSEINVRIKNSSQEFQNVQELKLLLQPLVQNGMLAITDLIRIQFAKSASEIVNYADQAQAYTEKKQQEQMDFQQQMLQKQEQMQQQLAQMQMEFQAAEKEKDRQARIQEAALEATMYLQSQDVDKNKVNDDITREIISKEHEARIKRMEIESKEKLEERKMQFEKEKQAKQIVLDKEKLQIERIKARKPSGGGKS